MRMSIVWDGTAARCPHCRKLSIFLDHTMGCVTRGSLDGDIVKCEHCKQAYALHKTDKYLGKSK